MGSAATVLYKANEADHYGLRGKLHPNCLTIKSIKRKRFYMAPILQKKRIQYIFYIGCTKKICEQKQKESSQR